MDTPNRSSQPQDRRDWVTSLRSIGPAIIVAAVVLGPGSITTASKVGCRYGYSMGWVLVLTTFLMIGMTLTALLIGLDSAQTVGTRLSRRFGRVPTALLGLVVFMIVALFQSSNNVALLLAAEIVYPNLQDAAWLRGLILVGVNAAIILFFLYSSSVYKILERSMLLLVGLMLACFGINAALGGLDFGAALRGLVPSAESLRAIGGSLTGDLRAMIGTTFSVGGAFYQAYLVRERGWSAGEFRVRWIDSVVGITTLGVLTLLVMGTASASLHGKMNAEDIKDLVTLAESLRPTFGPGATAVFASGILAGAISSFVGNALIGGTIFSDTLGFGSAAREAGPRRLTVLALLVGMSIALLSVVGGVGSVTFIVVAQGLTTLGLPLMACVLFYLLQTTSPQRAGLRLGLTVVVAIGVLVSCFVAFGTLVSLLG